MQEMLNPNENDEICQPGLSAAPLGGKAGLSLAKLLAPDATELRHMIRAIRERRSWSLTQMATAFSVSFSCIRKWQSGERIPGGCAAKLILFHYSLCFYEPDEIKRVIEAQYSGYSAAVLEKLENGTLTVLEREAGIENNAAIVNGQPTHDQGRQIQSRRVSASVARAVASQQYIFGAMQLVYQQILNLPDNKNRPKRLREMSLVLGQLSGQLTSLTGLIDKLSGACDHAQFDQKPLTRGFTPGKPIRLPPQPQETEQQQS